MKQNFECVHCSVKFILEVESEQSPDRACSDCSPIGKPPKYRVGFAASKNCSGRNVTGELRDHLSRIDKAYSKSTIGNSVNIAPIT